MTAASVVPPLYRDSRLPARFWAKVAIDPAGCWLWTSQRNLAGYATFHVTGAGKRLAHRFLWESLFGPVPGGRVLCHRCDVRACVNPDHLYVGTHKQNAKDCSARGRAAGSGRGKNKLTPDLVRLIRRRAAEGVRREAIAKEVGVSPRNVWYVLSGKTWNHVDAAERAAAGGAP